MENNVFRKDDLINILSKKTGFYKRDITEMVNALGDVIIECLQAATFDNNSELHLAPGVVLVGTRKPKGKALDPRNRSEIITPEKVIPSAIFKQSIRQKLYTETKYYQKKKKTT